MAEQKVGRSTLRPTVSVWMRNNSGKIIAFVFLLLLLFIWIMPVLWTLFSSLKPTQEAKQFFKLRNILPNKWTLENYVYVLGTKNTPIPRWLLNSVVVSFSEAALVILITSSSAYAYERLQFKGKEVIFWTVFGLSMLPSVVSVVPLYQIMAWVHLLDSLPAVILPGITGVFNIFLVRNFLKAIPKDLDEAARIDGAGEFRIYSQIMLPLLRPVLTVVGLFAFTSAWNDFVWPSIALTSAKQMTLTPGMRILQMSENGNYVRIMAGCMMAMVPTFIVYLCTQRFFLTGLNLSAGLKG